MSRERAEHDEKSGSEPAVTSPPLLEVSGLVVTYPLQRGLVAAVRRRPRRRVRAVDGVSLSLQRGELLALVGESGCGKTTTASAVLGLVDVDDGSIALNGQELTGLSERAMRPLRRRMQMTFQDPYEALDPRFRVRDTVAEPLRVHRVTRSSEERAARVTEALARAGLSPPEDFLDRRPHELSGGQRQRVAIAASLVLRPELLVADEPVSMLDVSVRAGLLALLGNLRRESGMAVLLITHDLASAAHVADRIAVMYLGRIVEVGPALAVVRSPRHPYTQALLSVVPRRDRRRAPQEQALSGEMPSAIDIPSGCRFHPRCPLAQPECRNVDPSLRRTREGAHSDQRAACILG